MSRRRNNGEIDSIRHFADVRIGNYALHGLMEGINGVNCSLVPYTDEVLEDS